MDVEEFAKKVKPKAKKSQMEPFTAQIFDLKNRGYADDQVKEWLELNGLVVSRQAVQQFVKKWVTKATGSTQENDKKETSVIGNKATFSSLSKDEITGEDEKSLDKQNTIQSLDLDRPSGISNASWNEIKAKHAKLNRK